MKKFILYISTIYLLVFGTIGLLNYLVDPAHIYHDEYTDKIIQGIAQGKCVTNITDLNEREYKLKLAELYSHNSYDYVVMGSSRIMQISSDGFPRKSFLNMGVSSCKIKDFKAIYQILKDYDVKYDTLLLGVDPIVFNQADDERVTLWKSIAKYYYEYEGRPYKEGAKWEKLDNLFSISYFKQTLEILTRKIRGHHQNLSFVETPTNDGATQRPDGAITYPKSKRETNQQTIDNDAATAILTHLSYKGYEQPSSAYIDDFNDFLDRVMNDGISVKFVFAPFHPLFYNGLKHNSGFVKGTLCLRDIAKKKNITIIGDYDPNQYGFSNTDFLDNSHPRKEAMDSLFLINYANGNGK